MLLYRFCEWEAWPSAHGSMLSLVVCGQVRERRRYSLLEPKSAGLACYPRARTFTRGLLHLDYCKSLGELFCSVDLYMTLPHGERLPMDRPQPQV